MKSKYDVVVVGAGTAGSFFAKRMAEKGYSVLVIDRSSENALGQRLDIFHIDKDYFDKYNVPKPKEGDADYVSTFDQSLSRSAYGNYPKLTEYSFIVMKLNPFLLRLKKWAQESGVEYSLNTKFVDLIYKDNKISGIKAEADGQVKTIEARLVADCSGIGSAVRTKLRPSTMVEDFKIEDTDKFYVILRYVKLKYPDKDRVPHVINYPYYKTWLAPQSDPNGALFGVGANLSYEYAEQCFEKFTKVIQLPEHELEKIEKGTTPYRRPPYSFVGDGFVTLGDSACITKPFSGEGITAAWNLCAIAADVAGEAMKNGAYPTREALWQTNVRYNRTQGADFANLLATLTGAVDATAGENDYEFKKDIVFKSDLMTRMNKEFASKLSLGDILALGAKVLGGVITGNIRFKTVKALLKSVTVAGALEKHYKAYPDSPEGFEEWRNKACVLWEKAGSMADNIIRMEKEQA
ncbi:MAG: FAD-dependent oxidoreductase [Christensenellales bacterium]|jgi:digeranylgeranylglycerophospholipid reductase